MSEAAPLAVVMAAGKSTRMKSDLPKVLHDLCGKPLLEHVLDALHEAGVGRKIVVVGYRADDVREAFADSPGVEFVEQTEQKGTGHAVMVCADALADHDGPVVVLAGDGPMLRPELVETMLTRFRDSGAAGLMATATVDEPFGYGRIVRDESGTFDRIVEQKDASPEQAALKEVNPSFYVFDCRLMLAALAEVKPNNVQGEYYVTDVPRILKEQGHTVVAEILATEADMFGINTREHLAQAHALMQARILGRHMAAGVTVVDARNTYVDARAEIGRETVVLPFSVIRGSVKVGANCRIGPFAHLRDGTVLHDEAVVGAFVETTRTTLGKATSVKHLAYLGDTVVGVSANVGAGAVVANWDGQRKHASRIGDGALVGSNSTLVAPADVGDAATVGAGAVVTAGTKVANGAVVAGVPAKPLGDS